MYIQDYYKINYEIKDEYSHKTQILVISYRTSQYNHKLLENKRLH